MKCNNYNLIRQQMGKEKLLPGSHLAILVNSQPPLSTCGFGLASRKISKRSLL
jgi:hypothetical protein